MVGRRGCMVALPAVKARITRRPPHTVDDATPRRFMVSTARETALRIKPCTSMFSSMRVFSAMPGKNGSRALLMRSSMTPATLLSSLLCLLTSPETEVMMLLGVLLMSLAMDTLRSLRGVPGSLLPMSLLPATLGPALTALPVVLGSRIVNTSVKCLPAVTSWSLTKVSLSDRSSLAIIPSGMRWPGCRPPRMLARPVARVLVGYLTLIWLSFCVMRPLTHPVPDSLST
mmetsp:Transcript_33621/g.83223  ORF Transcript_33621/g.83223 Transcript_33621/m.83223 type:complete len:229 (-) Transcript_33621:448-1134(-)